MFKTAHIRPTSFPRNSDIRVQFLKTFANQIKKGSSFIKKGKFFEIGDKEKLLFHIIYKSQWLIIHLFLMLIQVS
jgi:hypothetical protein